MVFVSAFVSCGEVKEENQESSIVGDWYNGQNKLMYSFGDDHKFRLKVDISETMTIDSNGTAHLVNSDTDYSDCCSYDGENYVFNIGGDVEMLNMKRKDGVNTETVFGNYTLLSGYFYEDFTEKFGDADGRYGIIISEDKLIAEIEMCSYSTDNGNLVLSGNDLSFFGGEDDGDRIMNYTIDGLYLTIINNGETMTFTRID